MTAQPKRKKQKNIGVRGFVFSSVSFIVICAALVFGMSVFFRVSNIEVNGAGHYMQQEIIEASGVKDGDNLMFVNRSGVAQKIYSKLIYIGEVTVSRKLPNTVVIEVSESGSVAVIQSESGLWSIDRNCRLLEECNTQDAQSYIKIKGLSAVKPEKGEVISVADEDKPKAEFLKGILTAMSNRNMIADVYSLDLSNITNVEFDYLDKRFTVKLGRNENLDYKFELLLGSIAKLDASDTGTIDLSQDKKAQFSPF
ncbi:MAG: FtsQ-type POTRA domain-containing protein [Oscillospiraceae bacterium]|nr:FtsQ-type POTRA domain-containing protein [Oscillospiraceae bacterium]